MCVCLCVRFFLIFNNNIKIVSTYLIIFQILKEKADREAAQMKKLEEMAAKKAQMEEVFYQGQACALQ